MHDRWGLNEDMSKLMVTLGATGIQGGSVAKTFATIPGWQVRGITRNPDKGSNQPLRDAGINLVSANLNSKESLVKAFTGANAIFAVTNFWEGVKDPLVAEEAKSKGVSICEICMQREIKQFQNIIDAAAEILKLEGKLERLVMSTLSNSRKWSHDVITENFHFDGKAKGSDYLKEGTTPELQALCTRTSWLQMGQYLDNWKSGANAPKKMKDGNIIFVTTGVPPYRVAIPYVHPPTDTGPYVKTLVIDAAATTTMLGTSQMLTTPQYVDLLAHHLGKPINIHPLSKADLIAAVGPDIGAEVAASGEYASTIGWDGGERGVKKPWELGVDMSVLTTPEKYINQTDWSSLLI